MGAVEQSGRSKGQTGTRTTRDSQSEDALPAALVGESRVGGCSDPQAGQEPVGTTLPPSEVRGRGSQPGSGPCPIGPLSSEPAFRVVPLTSRYVSLCCSSIFCQASLFWSVTHLYFPSAARGCRG